MKKSKKSVLWLVFGVCIIGGIILSFPYLKNFWTKPLGETIDLPTLTTTREIAQGTEQEQTTQEGITATASPAPLCGGPQTMIIEALGENQEEHLSDVIRIVRVDFMTPSIVVLDIPRDTWV